MSFPTPEEAVRNLEASATSLQPISKPIPYRGEWLSISTEELLVSMFVGGVSLLVSAAAFVVKVFLWAWLFVFFTRLLTP